MYIYGDTQRGGETDTGIRTGTNKGSRRVQGENFSDKATVPAQISFVLSTKMIHMVLKKMSNTCP